MSKYYSSTFQMFSGILRAYLWIWKGLKYIRHTTKQSQTTMLEIHLGTVLFLTWVSMRIEVEEFQDEMPFLLGTSEEDNTSEAEAVVALVFDRNWQPNAYYNSNVSTTQQNEIVHVIQTGLFVNN